MLVDSDLDFTSKASPRETFEERSQRMYTRQRIQTGAGPQMRMPRTAGFACLLLLTATFAPAALAEDLSGYSGAQLFQRFCASCHGKGGQGDGPVAPFFKLLPPDLTQLARRSGGQYPAEKVRRIIDGREVSLPHGAREMPVWGLELALAGGESAEARKQADRSISLLVEYLRTIQVTR